MTLKSLKWILGVSLALNLFLVAGCIGAGMVLVKHLHGLKRPVAATATWSEAAHDLTPQARARIKAVIKQAAISGEPEMEKARALRRQAAKLAVVEPFDAAGVIALSDQARSYEVMARSKIEMALIEDMAQLPPKERGMLARFILRPTFRFRKFLEKDGAPPTDSRPVPAAASANTS